MLARISVPPIFAFAITIMLFYLMQYLIATADTDLTNITSYKPMEIFRVKSEPQVITKTETLQPPPKPEVVPQLPTISFTRDKTIDVLTELLPPKKNTLAERLGNGFIDGDPLPIVKVQPRYPGRAKQRGQSGWVVVKFDINERGMVVNPVVVDHCVGTRLENAGDCIGEAGSVFDRAALNAVVKFKYQPKVVDQMPVFKFGVRNKFIFQLADS